MLGTHPNIAFAVITLLKHATKPLKEHLDCAFYICSYLLGTCYFLCLFLSYPWIWPSPTPTLDYLGPLTSVPPQITRIIQTIWSVGLSMTLYGLPHLDLIVLLSCHSLTSTCTRLGLRDTVSMPLGSLGTAPHSFLRILYLAAARTSTFPEHATFSLWTLPLYYTI